MAVTAGVFLAGVLIGWLLATYRIRAAIQVSASSGGTATGWRGRAKTYRMEIRCLCGSLLKFMDPVRPGYEPYPTGDSVTCPDCGRVKDLTEIRQLQKEVLG